MNELKVSVVRVRYPGDSPTRGYQIRLDFLLANNAKLQDAHTMYAEATDKVVYSIANQVGMLEWDGRGSYRNFEPLVNDKPGTHTHYRTDMMAFGLDLDALGTNANKAEYVRGLLELKWLHFQDVFTAPTKTIVF